MIYSGDFISNGLAFHSGSEKPNEERLASNLQEKSKITEAIRKDRPQAD